jgi:hypothetical protein
VAVDDVRHQRFEEGATRAQECPCFGGLLDGPVPSVDARDRVDDMRGRRESLLNEVTAKLLEPGLVWGRDADFAEVVLGLHAVGSRVRRGAGAAAAESVIRIVTYRPYMCLVTWALAAAEQELARLPGRLTHTRGLARQAQLVATTERLSGDGDVLVAAAYLHDIGYGPAVRRTGFHPLDGAMHLRALGQERLASLVAYHSCSSWEAAFRGLAWELAEFEREVSVVADALTYCDMTTGPNGEKVTLAERLADIAQRHGMESVAVRALRLARPEFDRSVDAIEELLRTGGRAP